MAQFRIPVLETFSWQPPVLATQNDPPGTPLKGDRYLVGTSPTGAWVGHASKVATYSGAAWLMDIATDGWALYDNATDKFRVFQGTSWSDLSATPTAHKTSHQSGGADAIQLDNLAAPDDNTDLDASTGQHGLLKKLGGGTSNFLRADGAWAAPPAPSTPTGTGFRKVVAGVEDAAAKLVENAEVHASAAIAESKLALNYATHSPANDPTASEKAALPGTSGTPSGTNKYVTNADPRNTDARTPLAHEHAGADITSGMLDGDRLPAMSTTKKGAVPPTGTPSGRVLSDGATWIVPSAGDMLKSVYDADADNIVDKAEALNDGTNNVTAVQAKEAYDRRGSWDSDYECILMNF